MKTKLITSLLIILVTIESKAGMDLIFKNGMETSPFDLDGDGYDSRINDCDDSSVSTHPRAIENASDGVDNNCNGFIDEIDMDNDGYFLNRNDCDDNNPDINRGSTDIPGDGIDNNCDGTIDNIDTDGDGLSDSEEGSRGTNISNADIDGDGLSDSEEFYLLQATDPFDADTDDDGLLDGQEKLLLPLTNPIACDTDSDNLPDGLEKGVTSPIPNGLDYFGTNTTSGCFIADVDPATMTNPLNSDSDNDLVSDGDEDTNRDGEVNGPETDPLDPNSN